MLQVGIFNMKCLFLCIRNTSEHYILDMQLIQATPVHSVSASNFFFSVDTLINNRPIQVPWVLNVTLYNLLPRYILYKIAFELSPS